MRREDVDLGHGVVNIRKSKGYDQHYIALHSIMTELLIPYDKAVDKIQPGRTYFFESLKGTCYGRDWVNDNFKKSGNQRMGQPKESSHIM
uniref:hypothetical protein n=1 Tax=Enterocloster clostridioformis TaxID=1531 RepID=UPI0034E84977